MFSICRVGFLVIQWHFSSSEDLMSRSRKSVILDLQTEPCWFLLADFIWAKHHLALFFFFLHGLPPCRGYTDQLYTTPPRKTTTNDGVLHVYTAPNKAAGLWLWMACLCSVSKVVMSRLHLLHRRPVFQSPLDLFYRTVNLCNNICAVSKGATVRTSVVLAFQTMLWSLVNVSMGSAVVDEDTQWEQPLQILKPCRLYVCTTAVHESALSLSTCSAAACRLELRPHGDIFSALETYFLPRRSHYCIPHYGCCA